MAQLWELNKRDIVADRQWWRDFVAAREKPWNDYVLYSELHRSSISGSSGKLTEYLQATVLLAVNVSFLAVPTTGPENNAVTVGSIASLCSTVMSVGCIVVGLLLVNEERTDPKTSDAVSCVEQILALI